MPAPCGHPLWISASAACENKKKEMGETLLVRDSLVNLGFLLPPLLNLLRYKMLVLKAGTNMIVKKTFSGLNGSSMPLFLS